MWCFVVDVVVVCSERVVREIIIIRWCVFVCDVLCGV